MMPKSMDFGKRFFGEKLFEGIAGYMKNDPEKNLDRIVGLLEKAPVAAHHKAYARLIRDHIQNNPATKQYIHRIIGELDKNIHNGLLVNLLINASLAGLPKQMESAKNLGYSVPYTILIDPTSRCNLSCKGCWAGAYDKHNSLSFNEVDRIVSEAKELGIYFIVMSGGEPTIWPHLSELCRKHSDVAFMIYTNGTLIDENMAGWMRETGNISPTISIEGSPETTDRRRGEGVYDRIMKAMDNLRENGVAFGFSVTATTENCEEILSDQFIDLMIDKGAIYGWSFHYIPIGSTPDFSLMLRPKQRAAMADRAKQIRSSKPILVVDFWNDGELTHGCIAGGKRYFHITATGDVEPCAFVHFAADNIKGKSLKEVLGNPLFRAYQGYQPFSENMLRPCPLIDFPEKLRSMIDQTSTSPTYKGGDAILYDTPARQIDAVAAAWKEQADFKWAEWNTLKSSKSEEQAIKT